MRRDYFEHMYAGSPDPWGFTTRWYEERKYNLTLAALTRRRYGSAFEPGCSLGVLTARLAQRCDRLLAVDLIESAVQQAIRRTHAVADAGQVDVRQWDAVHDSWPDGPFDLIVVSEMLYYLDPEVARRFVGSAVERLTDDGEMLLVHWRPRVPEYPMTGDEAHAIAIGSSGLDVVSHYADDDLVLDLLARHPSRTVAHREGLREEG